MTAHVNKLLLLLLGLSSCSRRDTTPPLQVPDAGARAGAKLRSVGPRLLSNQTSQPLAIVADALTPASQLVLGPPVSRSLPLTIVDARHGYARLPAGLDLGAAPEVLVDVKVTGHDGQMQLRLINDTSFPDLTAMVLSSDGQFAFTASTMTDTVFRTDLDGGTTQGLAVGDGPSCLVSWKEGATDWVIVGHLYAPELTLLNAASPDVRRAIPGYSMTAGLAVADGILFVAEQKTDSVAAIELSSGKEVWRTPIAPNPRELVVANTQLIVGSVATGALEVLDRKTGAVVTSLEPGPGTSIVGGGTAKYSAFVMNGKAPRDLAWSASLKKLFVASIGPNIGPNPDKMEVSMNGGVGTVDLSTGWVRHLGFGAGVTEALAIDDARALLYASDTALGLVRVLDLKKLAQTDAAASTALVQELALSPPPGFPAIRLSDDFNVKGRAGPSLHSGPRAIALVPGKDRLVAMERFTCTLSILDVRTKGKATVATQVKVCDPLTQPTRRLGQVLYHADLGRTAMSCDACHIDGHGEGVLFEKTMPLRIYRSTTVRGSRETPPYFTPASTHSMGETAKVVGGRNRFHNPDPLPNEIEALTVYASLIPTLPNPFVGADGAPVDTLTLPDGKIGHPRAGLALFEGKADCAGCHPAPQFTTDQDPETRGKFIDVGTPHFFPLREAMQNTRFEGFGIPALVGSWDVFPMLTTGLAGLDVTPEGAVRVNARFPLRVAVAQWAPKHGRADTLTPQELDDLLAYVMSL